MKKAYDSKGTPIIIGDIVQSADGEITEYEVRAICSEMPNGIWLKNSLTGEHMPEPVDGSDVYVAEED